jgi:hypothetical protein
VTDPRLDELYSVHQIRQLAYRYAYAVDSRDWPLMFSLWVEPGPDVETEDFPTLDLNKMRAMANDFPQGPTTLFVGNHLITFDGPDRAHGSVYCLVFAEWEVFYEQALVYQDVYERHDGQWLFAKRDHLLWWGREQHNPLTQEPANWPASQIGRGVAFDLIRRDQV